MPGVRLGPLHVKHYLSERIGSASLKDKRHTQPERQYISLTAILKENGCH
jgi:hypothetical protein